MADIEDFNGKIIEEFRANGGPHPEEASQHIWDQHRFGVLDLSPAPA